MNQELIMQMMEALEDFPVVALATIIQTWGSTPRKAGAKMVICPDGRTFGTIGGGCSEGEVKSRARLVMDTGIPVIHQVSMTGDIAADEGMICGGKMEVYIEPVYREDNSV
ncbi:hypothetical protein BBF96_15095 [Anoxybacter fermentans]|uniref:XdhC- CoxI domain-containing protein n=1 Tax=Anoxybacter fermentans TaxID=1323375 RepID=A0A3Q9HSZ3_9FIRM|nr:XdhC family protein [Anoxybacter fermentans]AZR74582.1 hypothetical protein BBF96_15095 [Anoxybacter fermentans]